MYVLPDWMKLVETSGINMMLWGSQCIIIIFPAAIPVTQLRAADRSMPSWVHPLARVQILPVQTQNCVFLQDNVAVINMRAHGYDSPVEKRTQTLAREHGWSSDLMWSAAGRIVSRVVVGPMYLLAGLKPPMGSKGGWLHSWAWPYGW